MEEWIARTRARVCYGKDTDKLFSKIAKEFIELGTRCQKEAGFFSVALGGGRTPVKLNEKIVKASPNYYMDWTKVFVFFSDERCVSKNHSSSNYKMICETLIEPLDIPKCNVFRIQGELNAEAAAASYEKIVMDFFGDRGKKSFDLALLGLGEDCHTASLFPESSALREYMRLIVPGGRGKEGLERVTMTFPLINNSNNIWFLICGEEKRTAFDHLLKGDYDPWRHPAQGVYSQNGNLVYFTDIEVM